MMMISDFFPIVMSVKALSLSLLFLVLSVIKDCETLSATGPKMSSMTMVVVLLFCVDLLPI